jgi:hypothetical protein
MGRPTLSTKVFGHPIPVTELAWDVPRPFVKKTWDIPCTDGMSHRVSKTHGTSYPLFLKFMGQTTLKHKLYGSSHCNLSYSMGRPIMFFPRCPMSHSPYSEGLVHSEWSCVYLNLAF